MIQNRAKRQIYLKSHIKQLRSNYFTPICCVSKLIHQFYPLLIHFGSICLSTSRETIRQSAWSTLRNSSRLPYLLLEGMSLYPGTKKCYDPSNKPRLKPASILKSETNNYSVCLKFLMWHFFFLIFISIAALKNLENFLRKKKQKQWSISFHVVAG